jgi:CheY-like chemotaxis protein
MWLVTRAGREAWKSQDTAIPERYRRLLRSIDEGLASGADGYVTKPYSKNMLIGVIKGVLG